MNKAFIGALALLSSNFAFAENLLIEVENVPQNSLFDIFMRAPFGFIALVVIGLLISKCNSK
ncbi:hypothetical protein [Gilliamella apicola]|uniref:hypothetical protein n=1 Tax=Gilliamella apicola TaxID=1196095 RepID=UPI002FEE3803